MTSPAAEAAKAHNHPEITPELVAEHGLKPDEYERILEIMGRPPSLTELGIYSVMWSEHCSYKSSKKWLKTLPTEGPQVICGPGENAGVVDIGDGQAAIFKIESHNHPSFIEPYQGAATGVGGIMRDVFTMGARPIANLNALRFGSPDHPKTRHLLSGVVAGIGGYGNCMGVPTVAGEVNFHPAYNGNILVNAMTVGLAPADRIFYSKAAGIGNPVIYVGAKTGRDGIHGATMASAEFGEDAEEKRPTVQVGDPFTEKLLLEACLELMATDAIVAIQDMGAAGLTSSSVEMTSKGGLGLEMDLDRVPQRETNMTAYEIMLSESQERMLMVLKPDAEDNARKIFEKWALDFAVIGHLTDSGRLVIKQHGLVMADLDVPPLVANAPEYDRAWETTPAHDAVPLSQVTAPADYGRNLLALLGAPDLCSRRWIWEQYDHHVMGDTVQGPGGDAAVVRVHGSTKGLAVTTDCTPRYCFADPRTGGAQAVVEAWRNLIASGAKPLAATNNLNFGNPEKPRIMGQLVGCVQGMGDACAALDFPIVSGNVSLYNETEGKAILPTPVIGGLGLVEDLAHATPMGFQEAGHSLILIGETKGHMGQSLYLRDCLAREAGAPPLICLETEKRNGLFVRAQILQGRIQSCHDVSDGGVALALADMALAGGMGVSVSLEKIDLPAHAFLFAEDQARYLVATTQGEQLLKDAVAAGVPALLLGETVPDEVTITGLFSLPLSDLKTAHEGWMPGYMAHP